MARKCVPARKLRLLYHDAVSAARESRLDDAISQFREILRFVADGTPGAELSIPLPADRDGVVDSRSLTVACRANLGLCYVQKGMLDEAAAELEEVVALEPGDWRTACALGRLYERRGDCGRAIRHFRSALATMPDCVEAQGGLARCYVDAGDPDQAIEASRAALKLDPGCVEARVSLAMALKQQGRADEALQIIREATSLPTDDVEFLYELADLWTSQGELAEAARTLEHALEIRPDFEPAIQMLAETYLVLGDAERALRTGARSQEEGAGRIPALDIMIIAAERLGDIDAALRHATELVDLAPMDAYVHFRLATVLQRHGDYANAMSRYALAMELAGGDEHVRGPAEDAIETLDSIQLHQIVALAASSLVFRANLKRDAEGTLEQYGFRLTDGALAMLASLDLDELPQVAGHHDHRMSH